MRISFWDMLAYSSRRKACGRSAPPLMPRLLRMNSSHVIFFFTCKAITILRVRQEQINASHALCHAHDDISAVFLAAMTSTTAHSVPQVRYIVPGAALQTSGEGAYPDIVLIGVEQDDGVAEDVDSVCIAEQVGALLVVVLAEGLHDAVNLLSLPRQPEALQVQPNCHIKGQPCTQSAQLLSDLNF